MKSMVSVVTVPQLDIPELYAKMMRMNVKESPTYARMVVLVTTCMEVTYVYVHQAI